MVEIMVAQNGKAQQYADQLNDTIVPLLLLLCEVTFFSRMMHHIVRLPDPSNRYS